MMELQTYKIIVNATLEQQTIYRILVFDEIKYEYINAVKNIA